MLDPDPRVDGGGVKRLLSAGVECIVGVEEESCRAVNAGWIAELEGAREKVS